jgi:hypothetical protein
MDIFKLVPTQYLTQNEIDAADPGARDRVQRAEPAEDHVAGDLDRRQGVSRSAGRNNAIHAERAKAVRDNLAKVDELRTGKEGNAAAGSTR